MKLSALNSIPSHQQWHSVESLPLSPEAQVVLLGSGVMPGWAGATIRNGYVQRHLIEDIVEHGGVEECIQVAITYRDEEFHLRLAKSPEAEVREALAEYTPFRDVLDVLIESSTDPWLYSLIAANRYASLEQLRIVSLCPDEEIYEYLPKNPVFVDAPLDASWGASFLIRHHPALVEEYFGASMVDARALGESWQGSLESLAEALSLVSR